MYPIVVGLSQYSLPILLFFSYFLSALHCWCPGLHVPPCIRRLAYVGFSIMPAFQPFVSHRFFPSKTMYLAKSVCVFFNNIYLANLQPSPRLTIIVRLV